MNFEILLQDKPCSCGMTHKCAIKHIVVGKDANKKLGDLMGDYRHVVLCADENTYAACGEVIAEQLGDRLQNQLIYHRDGLVIPNEEAVAELQTLLTEEPT